MSWTINTKYTLVKLIFLVGVFVPWKDLIFNGFKFIFST